MCNTRLYFYCKKCFAASVVCLTMILLGGCDYMFRGEYPEAYANTVWISGEPYWEMTVDADNHMTSIQTVDGKQIKLDIKFRGHTMYAYLTDSEFSEYIFSGHGIFSENEFTIDEIITDRLFYFAYDRITFYRQT